MTTLAKSGNNNADNEQIHREEKYTQNQNSEHSPNSNINTISTLRRPYSVKSFDQKPPFLPRLPEKIFNMNQTHLINDYYVSSDRNKNLVYNRPTTKSFVFKGDLLKASQVFLVLDTSMSESIKSLKTADTPWNNNVNKNSYKPCKSILSKNRVETACFIRSSLSRSNLLSSHSNRTLSSFGPDRRCRAPSLTKNSECSYENSQSNRIYNDLDKNSIKLKKFAEDLLLSHVKKSSQNSSYCNLNNSDLKQQEKKIESAEYAIHALNTIWELHKYALENSPYLKEILANQNNIAHNDDTIKKLKSSKEKTRTNLGPDYFEKMTHIYIDIEDQIIDKHSLAVAFGNLYHPDTIEIPGKLSAKVLAAANLLKFDGLINACVEKISHCLSKKIVGDCYKTAIKYNVPKVIYMCERWLEMHLIPEMISSIYLKDIPIEILTRVLKSSRLFTLNEFSNFMVIINWLFLFLNPDFDQLPPESLIITYFSSFKKEQSLIERMPYLKELLHSVRLHGITQTNFLNTLQQVNAYTQSDVVKAMMEIQQSFTHGGDMSINRIFETSAIRQGFVIDIDQNFFSEVFSLYGFNFELVAEKTSFTDKNNDCTTFQFYIQRLSTNDPILTYEQSQLETFSLRNDRFCAFSISVQYWYSGNQVFQTTGLRKQRFGKAKSQTTQPYEVVIPLTDLNSDDIPVKEVFVLFSFTFPPD